MPDPVGTKSSDNDIGSSQCLPIWMDTELTLWGMQFWTEMVCGEHITSYTLHFFSRKLLDDVYRTEKKVSVGVARYCYKYKMQK